MSQTPGQARALRAVIGTLISLMLCAVIFFHYGGNEQQKQQPKSPEITSSTLPTSGPTHGSSMSPAVGSSLNDRVKAFVRLYYSFTPGTTTKQVTARIQPYVSKQFIRSTTIVAGSMAGSVSGQQILKASTQTGINSEISGNTVGGRVPVTVTRRNEDGTLLSENTTYIYMIWQRQHGRWVIVKIGS